MKIFSSEQVGSNGETYSVRYLLTDEGLAGLQAAGLVPLNACEVVAMQPLADGMVAQMERNSALLAGAGMQ